MTTVECRTLKPGDELPCERDQLLDVQDSSTELQGRVADVTLRVWWLEP